jgi:hypothetical protein
MRNCRVERRDVMMRRGDILMRYNDMSDEEHRAVDQWIGSSFFIASIAAGGVLFMALAGAGVSVSLEQANAAVGRVSPVHTAASASPSAFDLMSTASDQLPRQAADEQAF